jgi:hypothetical protein
VLEYVRAAQLQYPFADYEVAENFELPKLHSAGHYDPSIRLFGTTDNYNTEQTERLHIEFAKEAYRASNKKDYHEQMIYWLQRRETMWEIKSRVVRHDQASQVPANDATVERVPRTSSPSYTIRLAKRPATSASLQILKDKYKAPLITEELKRFIFEYSEFKKMGKPTRRKCPETPLSFSEVEIWHHIKFGLPNLHTHDSEGDYLVDLATIRPIGRNFADCGTFPTVLVARTIAAAEETGIGGMSMRT